MIDFTDLAKPSGERERTFEFMIPTNLPDESELLTAKINAATAERAINSVLDLLLSYTPEDTSRAKQWREVQAALLSEPDFQDIGRHALGSFTANLRTFTQYAVEIALGYSLSWSLIPFLERAGGNSFRADFVQSLTWASLEKLAAPVVQLRSEVERCLDERAGESAVYESNQSSEEG